MLEYAPMLHVSCYAQNLIGIIRQGLAHFTSKMGGTGEVGGWQNMAAVMLGCRRPWSSLGG